jgi:hypothetical protein
MALVNLANPCRRSEKAYLVQGAPVHLADVSLDTDGPAWYAVGEASQSGGFTKQNGTQNAFRGLVAEVKRFTKCIPARRKEENNCLVSR